MGGEGAGHTNPHEAAPSFRVPRAPGWPPHRRLRPHRRRSHAVRKRWQQRTRHRRHHRLRGLERHRRNDRRGGQQRTGRYHRDGGHDRHRGERRSRGHDRHRRNDGHGRRSGPAGTTGTAGRGGTTGTAGRGGTTGTAGRGGTTGTAGRGGAGGTAGAGGAIISTTPLDCGPKGWAVENHGPPANRVNYVVLGDGYTSAQSRGRRPVRAAPERGAGATLQPRHRRGLRPLPKLREHLRDQGREQRRHLRLQRARLLRRAIRAGSRPATAPR